MTYPSPVNYLLIGKETSWASGGSAAKDCGIWIRDLSTPHSREPIEVGGLSAIQTQAVFTGMGQGGLTLRGDFQHGRLLEYVFGSVAHALTSADTKHTFTISNTPPSMIAEVGNNLTVDTTQTITGLIAESCEISSELNGLVQLSVDFKGKIPTTGSTASAAVTSSLTTFPHSYVIATINGTQATEVQNMSIRIVKTTQFSGGLGSVVYQQGHATSLRIEVSGKLGFAAKTFHDIFVNATSHTIIFDATNGVSLGSGLRELKITLGSNYWTNFTEIASLGGLTYVEFSGICTLTEAFSVDNIAEASW